VVLTTTYFVMVVRRVAQGTSFQAGKDAVLLRDATTHELVVWSPVVALVVAFGLWPGWLLEATDPVVRRLLGGS
jgi:NADH-quinone oxidoreductase subunit M